MTDTELQIHGPDDALWTLLLTHSAGAPADSPLLDNLAVGLGARGVRVIRFEFPYMAARREHGRRRPPDRAAVLLESWSEQIRQTRAAARLLAIGGHSMGGRYATLLAASSAPEVSDIDAVVAIGYPFKPARVDEPRIAHLADVRVPLLIVQGTRDAFGNPAAVRGWSLPSTVRFSWIEDGDHSLVPRRASGRTRAMNHDAAAEAVAAFLHAVGAETESTRDV